jgi:hypothetical protein
MNVQKLINSTRGEYGYFQEVVSEFTLRVDRRHLDPSDYLNASH